MSVDRVVVTGLGCACASGTGIEELRGSLATGHSGVVIEGEDRAAWKLGPEPVTFGKGVSKMALRRLDKTMRMALHAARQAVLQAGLDTSEERHRFGLVVGTGFAGSGTSLEYMRTDWKDGPSLANPSLFPNTVPNGPAGQLTIQLKLRGPLTNFFDAGVAGENAVAYARSEIVAGNADAMVVCGVDERSEPVVALESVYARAAGERHPDGLLRPFGNARSGATFGEAAGVLVLESEAHARARGATVLAECGPVARRAEATPPGTRSDHPGMLAAVAAAALLERGWEPADLGFVSAAACGSPEFDRMEAAALRAILAGTATMVPVVALKGYCGELSSSGVLRAVMAVLSLEEGFVPPSARVGVVDAELGLSVTAGDAPRPLARGRILQLGAGAGGGLTALTLSRP